MKDYIESKKQALITFVETLLPKAKERIIEGFIQSQTKQKYLVNKDIELGIKDIK